MQGLLKRNIDEQDLISFGFRLGQKGTHSSRTIMFDDLAVLFSVQSQAANRPDYAACIIEANCLAKHTTATRRHSNQNLGELYALDPQVAMFRIFRNLWSKASQEFERRLLALECAIARDPLLAASAQSVVRLPEGGEFLRDSMRSQIKEEVGERLNDRILDKVIRNAASSWSQSGHLVGRTFKKRVTVIPTPVSVAFGLCLAHRSGFRGRELFSSAWMSLIDCKPGRAEELALEAKRLGYIDMRILGDVIEMNLDRLDPLMIGAEHGSN